MFLAEAVLNALKINEKKISQSIIISGLTGAGKTESKISSNFYARNLHTLSTLQKEFSHQTQFRNYSEMQKRRGIETAPDSANSFK